MQPKLSIFGKHAHGAFPNGRAILNHAHHRNGESKKGPGIGRPIEPLGVVLKTLGRFPRRGAVPEDGDTFAANAVLKAAGYARQLQCWVLADDSGLLVDALDGEPGVLSARFTGEDATDEGNNRLLLERLGNTPIKKRSAQFVCHMALADTEARSKPKATLHAAVGFFSSPAAKTASATIRSSKSWNITAHSPNSALW